MSSKRLASSRRRSSLAELDLGRTLRAGLTVLLLLLSWVTVAPFQSMADPALLAAQEDGVWLNQAAYLGLGILVGLAFLTIGREPLRPLARPLYLVLLAWLVVAVLTSTHPDVSARRFVFAVLVITFAGAVLVLPQDAGEFADLLAWPALAIVAACWFGIVLVPDLAVHQATDLIEPRLAGDWRGLFQHKNIAGAMMALFIFLGLYVAERRNAILGWALVLGSGTFLVFCNAKTNTLLLPSIFLLVEICRRLRSRWKVCLTGLAGLAGLNLATLGSVMWEPVAALTRSLPDPTFTGRTEIWSFAIDHARERLVTGYGFMAFWRTSAVEFGGLVATDAQNASHAHNSFLDLALTIGMPGLALALTAFAVAPLTDYVARPRNRADDALATLFLRIFLFCLYTAAFESIILDRGNPVWFTMLIAILGLRNLSVSGTINKTQK